VNGTLRSRVPVASNTAFAIAAAPSDEDGARAALAEPAAEFRAVQRELIAQDVEQRLRRIPGIGGDLTAIQAECVSRHNGGL